MHAGLPNHSFMCILSALYPSNCHTVGVEYVKVVLHQGRMQGAVLIGETDLEVSVWSSIVLVNFARCFVNVLGVRD